VGAPDVSVKLLVVRFDRSGAWRQRPRVPRSVRQVVPWIALIAIVLGSTRAPSHHLGMAALDAASFSAGDDVAWQGAPATNVAPQQPPRAGAIERFRSAPARARALGELAAVPRSSLDRPPRYVLHGVYRV